MLLLAEFTEWVGLAGGMLLLAWVVFRRRFRGAGPFPSSASTGSSSIFRSSLLRRPAADVSTGLLDAPASIIRWEVGMHEVARDLRAELDSKMVALNVLIGQAREESARLASMIQRAERLGLAPVHDTLRAIEDLGSDDPQLVAKSARALESMSELMDPPAMLAPRFVEQIYALTDEGRTPGAIAQQLGAPVGDVEFALGLRPSTAKSC